MENTVVSNTSNKLHPLCVFNYCGLVSGLRAATREAVDDADYSARLVEYKVEGMTNLVKALFLLGVLVALLAGIVAYFFTDATLKEAASYFRVMDRILQVER